MRTANSILAIVALLCLVILPACAPSSKIAPLSVQTEDAAAYIPQDDFLLWGDDTVEGAGLVSVGGDLLVDVDADALGAPGIALLYAQVVGVGCVDCGLHLDVAPPDAQGRVYVRIGMPPASDASLEMRPFATLLLLGLNSSDRSYTVYLNGEEIGHIPSEK